jgi:hypothetical protein
MEELLHAPTPKNIASVNRNLVVTMTTITIATDVDTNSPTIPPPL